jgi:hypothetical protein
VTVCAYDYPGTQACPPSQLSPILPRFNVDQGEAVGITSAADGNSAFKKRINGFTAADGSTERMSLTFNCTQTACGSSITTARLVLNRIDGSSRTVLLYPTRGGTIVDGPLVVNPGGTNGPGITATFSGGSSTIDLSEAALADLPPFDGFQIGGGSANTRFTFRLADVTFGPDEADFVDFGCRIDLAQADVDDPFKFTLAATSSEKFCPQNNDGVLKLNCSGKIPGYKGRAVTSTDGVECRISGSQCGYDMIFEADVESIDVKADGTADLACAAQVAG